MNNTAAKKIGQKVMNVRKFTIPKKKSSEIVKLQSHWSAPGIDTVQNCWWKKLSAILTYFN